MKRDMELIWKIVLKLEDEPSGFLPQGIQVDGHSPDQVAYHSYLMIEAGLAKGVDVTTLDATCPEADLTRLTWAGHEFADAARDETRWRKALGIAKKKGGSLSSPY